MGTNNAINANGTGIIVYDGTSTFSATTTTQYSVLVGDVNNTIANVAGSDGLMLIGFTGASPSFRDTLDGSFTFQQSFLGTETLTVQNLDNTSVLSNSRVTVKTGGTSGGSPAVDFNVVGTGKVAIIGMDNAASQALKISYNSLFGTNDTVIIDANGGQYKGYATNTAPASGFIGEHIQSTILVGSPLGISNASPVNLTSINLTAGVWDVSAIAQFSGYTIGTDIRLSISSVSGTEGTPGDSLISAPWTTLTGYDAGLSIPAYRILLNAPATIYAVVAADFSMGSCNTYGRISAVRVA